MTFARLEDTFYDSRKVKRLAATLGVPHALAAGHLALLWSWALVNEVSGDVTDYAPEELEEAMRWEGEPGDLYHALLDERPEGEEPRHRFLDREEDGAIVIHNWLEHADGLRKAQYMRNYRKKQRNQKRKAREENAKAREVSRRVRSDLIGSDLRGEDPEGVQREGAGAATPAADEPMGHSVEKKQIEPELDFQLRRSLDMADEFFGPIEGRAPLASRPTLRTDYLRCRRCGLRSDEPDRPCNGRDTHEWYLARSQLELVPPAAVPASRVASGKAAVAAWDRGREGTGLPTAREPRGTTPHGKRFAEALRAHPNPDEWEWCARALSASPFHCGQNDSGWRASFVWLLERGQGERLEEWMQRGKELRERGGKPLLPPRPVAAGRRVGAEAKDDTAAAARRMMEENNAKVRREAAEREARARAGPVPVKMDEETRKIIDRLKGPGGGTT